MEGKTYEGEFKSNVKEGQGIYIWIDGRAYSGSWNDNQQDGTGYYIQPNKDVTQVIDDQLIVKKGIWENGKRIEWIENVPEEETQNQK